MAANLTLIALNNENRISFGCNFELYMIVMKVRLRMKMMLIALVPDSICFNKVAAAVVGPRSQNRTGCSFAKTFDAADGALRGGMGVNDSDGV